MKNKKIAKNRWFIWTIVFLLAAGVLLTTWIVSSDDGMGIFGSLVHHQVRIVHGKVVPVK